MTNKQLTYNGLLPTINDDKLSKYEKLTGRHLDCTDIDLYVRNYIKDHGIDKNTFQLNQRILSEIIDHALDLEIAFRS